LRRAEAINPKFNAFTMIEHEAALAAARASESRWRRRTPHSAIDGIPTTIKDIVRVAGWVTRYGSRTGSPGASAADAPAVAALRAAGAVLIGQTTTPEFGWKAVTDSAAFGVTRNPWNPALTPGGSSGGAAVAAATGAGVLHLGTDGGGSIRIPAAFTGIFGHKPSFGLVPAYPASAFGTLAHIGPMARNVFDARAALAAMARRDAADWCQNPVAALAAPVARDLRGTKIGVWRTPPCHKLDPGIGAVFDAALDMLAAAGAVLEPLTLPGPDIQEIFEMLWFSGAANRLSGVAADELERIDPGLREIAAIGRQFSAVDYIAAGLRRAEFGAAMDRLLDLYDCIVSPATAIPPFTAGLTVPEHSGLARWHEWAGFSFPLNLSQQPACVLPCGVLPDGLPVGLQLIGARFGDAGLLDMAAAVEAILA
jgi:amidase/aspartyl-tRNA(Asn)/glutamyl-tRNA(Gln) amidotransferase subunit A